MKKYSTNRKKETIAVVDLVKFNDKEQKLEVKADIDLQNGTFKVLPSITTNHVDFNNPDAIDAMLNQVKSMTKQLIETCIEISLEIQATKKASKEDPNQGKLPLEGEK